jgi:hypothetical protein
MRISPGAFSADHIKETVLDDRPTIAAAIFPLEQYTGTITTDLFAEDETSYFARRRQDRCAPPPAVACGQS